MFQVLPGFFTMISSAPHTFSRKISGHYEGIDISLVSVCEGTWIKASVLVEKLLKMAGVDDCVPVPQSSGTLLFASVSSSKFWHYSIVWFLLQHFMIFSLQSLEPYSLLWETLFRVIEMAGYNLDCWRPTINWFSFCIFSTFVVSKSILSPVCFLRWCQRYIRIGLLVSFQLTTTSW